MAYDESQADIWLCCQTWSWHVTGEELYPLVAEFDEPNAGKITGMLLEMNEAEVINIIEDRQACEEKVCPSEHQPCPLLNCPSACVGLLLGS